MFSRLCGVGTGALRGRTFPPAVPEYTSCDTGGAAASDVGQAFSWFEPMLKINELAWCHRSEVSRAVGGAGLHNL